MNAQIEEENLESLFKRLGGKPALEAAVDGFYDRVLADENLAPFFDGVDMDKQRSMLSRFLSYAFGGVKTWKGKSMQQAHRGLGISNDNFDAVVGHLAGTLESLGVGNDLIEEVAIVAETVRDDIVAKPKPKKAEKRSQSTSEEVAGNNEHYYSAVNGSATATMMVDRDLVVTYANPATYDLLNSNLSVFEAEFEGFSVDALIGTCIDVFHKHPERQRTLLNDPKNLPFQTDIQIGPMTFELNVSAMIDGKGNYIGNSLEWANVSEARLDRETAARVQSSVDGSATPIMMVDRDLTITYANKATLDMVSKNLDVFKDTYPGFELDELIGSCIDIFHKDPSHQRKILSDASNLPWSADVQIGPLQFALSVSAMLDASGNYIGNTLEWSDVTQARNDADNAARVQSSVDGSATSIMMVDRDLTITYANDSTMKMVRENEHFFKEAYPGFELDQLVGSCIDVFHKDPAHQRKILSDPDNLPWSADIQIGPLQFALSVSAMLDASGNYIGNTLEWSNVTETRKLEQEAARIQSAIEGSATNMMMIDRDFVITYANPATMRMMRENVHVFQEAFPGFNIDNILGTCIDVFHKNPQHQRTLLADPANLPYEAEIVVGPLQFRLNVSAMRDSAGDYIGNTLEWSNITAEKAAEASINETISQVDQRTNELNIATDSMVALSDGLASQVNDMGEETSNAASGAEELSNTMASISAAAEQASANINSVAVSTEEMTNSVAEIANNTERARDVTQDAVKNVENASARVDDLDSAGKEISQVIEAIVEIADQTKLLALNATIEAARAGEAGKGFAVVANEVKELAKQTREATADIRTKIENMQASTQGTVDEIGNINRVMNDVNEIVGIIATSVEEQNVATKDIAANISQATGGVKEVTSSVVQAATVSKEIAENINNVNGGIQGVSNSTTSLNDSISSVNGTASGLSQMVDALKSSKKD